MRIILASKSPRRRELLSELFSDFEIIVSSADESLPSSTPPVLGVAIIAERKGQAVFEELCRHEGQSAAEACLIISSDTLVELDGEPLGKPKDKDDAYKMIKMLSGREHFVRTGVSVSYQGRTESETASTAVYFREIPDDEICEYISTPEPYDKAGGYGIQGLAGKFVEEIKGDYDTVVGLSLTLVKELVAKALKTKSEN